MSKTSGRSFVILNLAVVCSVASTLPKSAGAAEANQLPPTVRRALEENFSWLSPTTVEWQRTRTTSHRLRDLLSLIKWPESDLAFLAVFDCKYVWQDGSSYALYVSRSPRFNDVSGAVLRDQPLQAVYKEIAVQRETGKVFSGNGRPVGITPLLIIDTVDSYAKQQPTDILNETEYFLHAGFKLPRTCAEHKEQPDSELLYLLARGAQLTGLREDKLGTENCLVAEVATSERKLRFYLLPERHYAVRRRDELTTSGALLIRTDNSKFEKNGHVGLWLPRRSEVEHYSWISNTAYIAKEPLLREVFTVLTISHEQQPPGRFELRYEDAGTRIADGTLQNALRPGRRVYYEVPADPKDLDRAIEAALEGRPYIPARHPPPLRVGLLAAAVLVAVVLIVLCVRRARRGGGRGP